MIPRTYTFWHDPGHAWLEVPVGDLKELGLTHSISRYSYQKGEQAFLEEGCDATTFIGRSKSNVRKRFQEEDLLRNSTVARTLNLGPMPDPLNSNC